MNVRGSIDIIKSLTTIAEELAYFVNSGKSTAAGTFNMASDMPQLDRITEEWRSVLISRIVKKGSAKRSKKPVGYKISIDFPLNSAISSSMLKHALQFFTDVAFPDQMGVYVAFGSLHIAVYIHVVTIYGTFQSMQGLSIREIIDDLKYTIDLCRV
ncbi:MAG: hypothetical protein QXY99_04110 [Thermoproteota archaeon]